MILHINGMPGVGKLTVAKHLSQKIQGHFIDNHLVIDLVTSIAERGSSDYMVLIRKLMSLILEKISQSPHKNFIFTNALTEELPEDIERLEQIRTFADKNMIPYVQVLIQCELNENKRRITSYDRKAHKLRDAEVLESIKIYTLYHPITEYKIEIDTSALSAEETSEKIVEFLLEKSLLAGYN